MTRFWIPLLLLASCSSEDWSDPAKVAAATTDVQIIEAVLSHRLQCVNQIARKRSRSLVVSSLEHDAMALDRAEAQAFGWGQAETWDAFFAAESRPLLIPPQLETSFHLVSDFSTRMGRGCNGQWYGGAAGFQAHEGYYFFDSLTLSPDGKEAIVYSAYVCGETCGSAIVFRLIPENGRWQVVNEELIWSSNPLFRQSDPNRTY